MLPRHDMLSPTLDIPPLEGRAMRFRGICDRFRPDARAAIALVALVLAIFTITVTFDFVDYDDHQVVVTNPFVNGGLTWRGLSWAWGFERGNGSADWYNWPLDRCDVHKSPWRLIGEKSVVLAFAVATVVIGYRAQDTAGAIHEAG